MLQIIYQYISVASAEQTKAILGIAKFCTLRMFISNIFKVQ